MTSLDKQTMKALRKDIDAALAPVIKKYGLEKLQCGNGSYSPVAGSFHFKLEGLVSGGNTPEAQRYGVMASAYDLPPLNSIVRDLDGTEFRLVGLNTTGSKVQGIHQRNGKTYLIPTARAKKMPVVTVA